MMKDFHDVYSLNNGMEIPAIGYGTWKSPASDITSSCVCEAIRLGYRHIDTASVYNNEEYVAKGVRESGIDRRDLFLTTKLWNPERGYDRVRSAFEASLKRLGLDYLDLYLIHWPANEVEYGSSSAKVNQETWRAFEELYEEGCIKAIGLSNFLPHHIEQISLTANVKPMVNQIEVHPGFTQKDTVRYCQDNDIVVEAWSPLGNGEVLSHPTIQMLSRKYNVQPAKLCYRWIIQQGIIPLTKSLNKEHIKENMHLFDFEISGEDMDLIKAIPRCGGQCSDPNTKVFQ